MEKKNGLGGKRWVVLNVEQSAVCILFGDKLLLLLVCLLVEG